LRQVERVDGQVPPVALVHPIVSVVVFAALKLSVWLGVSHLDWKPFPGAILLKLSYFTIWHLCPLPDDLLEVGTVVDGVVEQVGEGGLGEEALLHVVGCPFAK